MRFISIFENYLYSVQNDTENQHELAKLFSRWNDTEYLFDFFLENKADLENGFWDSISIEDAVFQTLNEVISLEESFYSQNILKDLEKRFRPLNSTSYYHEELEKSKSYGLRKPSWLRIYAIKTADCYIVTGGAIKLTREMKDRQHTNDELLKLEKLRSFLVDEGICDSFGINEFMEII